MIVGLNGQCIDDSQAVVSIYDHGFLYGIGLFETFRTYGGRAFLLDRHLDRMRQGLAELAIRFEPKAVDVERLIAQLLEANALADAYVRYTVTAGEDILGLPGNAYDRPTVVVYVKPLPAASGASRSLQLLRLSRNTPESGIRLKSLHYMNNILGKRELLGYPWASGAEGLFLDGRGYLAEGLVSNVFFVSDGVLHTPDLGTGILPGVTRQFVLELAQRLGLKTEEGFYRWEALREADEVFLTNSVQELVAVGTLFDGEGRHYPVGNGCAGPWTKRLREAYAQEAWRAGRAPGV